LTRGRTLSIRYNSRLHWL